MSFADIYADAGNMNSEEGDHPLQTSWAFWYDKKGKVVDPNDYRQRLNKLGSFDTVEGFWKLYCYLKRPSNLDLNVNLYLFRHGPEIIPMWEAFPRFVTSLLLDCNFSYLSIP